MFFKRKTKRNADGQPKAQGTNNRNDPEFLSRSKVEEQNQNLPHDDTTTPTQGSRQTSDAGGSERGSRGK